MDSNRRAATPIAFIRTAILAYQRRDKDPSQALQRAQIAPATLAEVDGRITARQMEQFCETAMRELDDEALGWFSRRLPWGSYGLLCRASLGSPTLGIALKRWCRHHRLLVDDVHLQVHESGRIHESRRVHESGRVHESRRIHEGGRVDESGRVAKGGHVPEGGQVQDSGGLAGLEISEVRPLDPEMRAFCLLTLLRYVHGYACWLIDSRIPLRAVNFAHPPPRHHAAYAAMFPGPVLFNAAATGIVFPADYLTLTPRRDEAALRSMLHRALPLTVLQYRRDRLVVQRVRELLPTHRTAEALASRLHRSVRTLHRQLAHEGIALQQLKDEVRRDQAIEALTRSSRSIKQIAHDAGFDNQKSFSRAFRRWTGTTPTALRENRGPTTARRSRRQ